MIRLLVYFYTLLALLPLHAEVGTKLLASGLNQPLWVSCPKGVNDMLWVVEKEGTIRTLNPKTGDLSDFLDIRHLIKIKMNEQGLLGLAFSPDYLQSGKFYVYYTNLKGDTEICRFTANGPDKRICDATTRELILSFKQNARNHNGGWIGFGPDGLLYIASGDGGMGNDPLNHGQKLTTLLGKILRIDVSTTRAYRIPEDNPFINHPKAKPEIYAYGLRNPWRCSWDRETHDFYIGDVGQNKHEEINYVAAGKGKGANYGWRLREGLIATPSKLIGGPHPDDAIDPIYTYQHGSKAKEGKSVTGGYVYRGPIECLRGKYFFADYVNPRIWSFEVRDGKMHNFEDWTELFKSEGSVISNISSFGEDNDGNLFIVSLAGKIYQVIER